MKFNISGQFFEKILKNLISWMSFQWKSSCHAGRRTGVWTDSRRDMTRLIVAFRNFSKAPIQEYNTETRTWSECKI